MIFLIWTIICFFSGVLSSYLLLKKKEDELSIVLNMSYKVKPLIWAEDSQNFLTAVESRYTIASNRDKDGKITWWDGDTRFWFKGSVEELQALIQKQWEEVDILDYIDRTILND